VDQPLAALDASARTEVRRDLKRHLASFDGVRLLVTHDPLEAVALADRLVVIENGKLVQEGTPAEVTERPRSAYVADLVGVNLLRGVAEHGSVRTDGGHVVAAAGATSGEVFAVIILARWRCTASAPKGARATSGRGVLMRSRSLGTGRACA